MFLGTRYPGHFVLPAGCATLTEYKELELKKRQRAQEHASTGGLASDTLFAKRYPNLVEALTDEQYEDGTRRDRSKITLTVQNGQWSAGLSEPSLQETAWMTGESLQSVLDALEAGLDRGLLDWRAWPGVKNKKK
jgi:hypothetical protein